MFVYNFTFQNYVKSQILNTNGFFFVKSKPFQLKNFKMDSTNKDFHAKRRALKSKAKAKAKKAKETAKQTPKKKGKKPKSKNKGNQLKTKHSGKMDESVVPLDTFYESMSFRIGCGVIAAISVIMVIVYYLLYHF